VIVIDIGTLVTRERPDPAKAARYATALRAGSPPLPIEVMPYARAWNGRRRWLIVDGHHRVLAARAEGHLSIAAVEVTHERR
jgi:hypothetical protein